MYKYETHLHTWQSSLCGKTKAELYPAYYKNLGYDGIIITDHFFNGNCAVKIAYDWKDMVNRFCYGYELAKEAGDAIDFKVFFGWEDNFEGDEYLVYGLDKNWLLEHKDILEWNRTEHYDRIHADGGLVVQAHPYRERGYLNAIRLNPETCDACEGYNSFNSDHMNHNSVRYAHDYNLPMTAGSDFHEIGSLPDPKRHFAMEFEEPLSSSKDYADAILAGKGNMVVAEEFRGMSDVITTELPVIVNHR